MKNDLGKDEIKKLVWKVAIPCMIAQFINVLYSIVDRVYIGHLPFIGDMALAGVGVCGPIVTLISAFASLIGIGGGPLCALAMGEKDNLKAEKIVANSFKMLIVISILIMIIVFPLARKMLMAFGAGVSTIDYALSYFKIYLLGTPFALLSIGMNNFINCQGYSKISMLSVIIGAILNIILDPLFMFVFNMGVKGAAIATITSQFVSCVFVLSILLGNKLEIGLHFLKFEKTICFSILKLGFTAFIIIVFDNIMIIAMNALLQKYGGEMGDVLISVNTILQSFMLIVTMPLGGISGGTQCILSYNYGAYKTDRVKKAYRYITKICALYCVIMFMVVWLLGDKFILLFNNNELIVEHTLKAMHIYTLFIVPLGLQYEFVDGMTALGQAKISLFLSFFRKAIYFISLFLLPELFGVEMIFLAEAISDFISPIVSYFVVKRNFNHIMENRLWNKEISQTK